jgi:hypothetical protein
MTTFTVPDVYQSAITFQVELDSASYTLMVWWNIFGQRSYFTITDLFSNRVVTSALIGSSTTEGVAPVNLIAGYFKTSVMYYYPENQVIVVAP